MSILSDIFERGGVAGDVLVLADSTIANGVDKWHDASWYTMSRDVERACPSVSSVWFCAYSGATIDGLTKYAEESLAGWGDTYDFAVVVAGWNSNSVGDGAMRAQLARLRDFIGQRIRRIGDKSGRGCSSGVGPIGSSNQGPGGGDRCEEGDRISGGVRIDGVSRCIRSHGDDGMGGEAENGASKLGGLGGGVDSGDRR